MLSDPVIRRFIAATACILVIIFAVGAFLGYVPIPESFVTAFWLVLAGLMVPLAAAITITINNRNAASTQRQLLATAKETQAKIDESNAITLKVAEDIKKSTNGNGNGAVAAQQARDDMVQMTAHIAKLATQLTQINTMPPPPPTVIVVPTLVPQLPTPPPVSTDAIVEAVDKTTAAAQQIVENTQHPVVTDVIIRTPEEGRAINKAAAKADKEGKTYDSATGKTDVKPNSEA